GSSITYPDGRKEEYFSTEYKAIPLKGGIRAYAGKRLFFAGELGASLGLNATSLLKTTHLDGNVVQTPYGAKNSILYAVSAGYSFDNGFETGIKFEDYINFKYTKQFNLRFAYRFKL